MEKKNIVPLGTGRILVFLHYWEFRLFTVFVQSMYENLKSLFPIGKKYFNYFFLKQIFPIFPNKLLKFVALTLRNSPSSHKTEGE